jgi:hypothetical protein
MRVFSEDALSNMKTQGNYKQDGKPPFTKCEKGEK